MAPVSRVCSVLVAILALVLGPAGSRLAAADHRAAVPHRAVPAASQPGQPMVRAGGAARPSALPATSNIGSVDSRNWSGYAASRKNTKFRSVRATFFVPYLNCGRSTVKTLSSDWVGLDGFVANPDSVEQTGIGADCSAAKVHGKASYFAWFEMFPFPESKATMAVHAGDSITASVSYDAATKHFRLTLTDNTRGEHFTRIRKCPDLKVGKRKVGCPRNSAELVSEAPATGAGKNLRIARLSDYGAVSFEAISITDSAGQHGGILSAHWSATKIIQLRYDGGPIVATPTPTQANNFDNYWIRQD